MQILCFGHNGNAGDNVDWRALKLAEIVTQDGPIPLHFLQKIQLNGVSIWEAFMCSDLGEIQAIDGKPSTMRCKGTSVYALNWC